MPNLYNQGVFNPSSQASFFGHPNAEHTFGNLAGAAGAAASKFNPYIAAGSAVLGLIQTGIGLHGLNQIRKEPVPQYGASPELKLAYDRANEMATGGYTDEETAAFKGNLAQANNTAYQNAVNQSGGNLAQVINSGIQSQNIGALNDFAAKDADLHYQNIQYADQFANQFQNIQDDNTRQALQYRLMREQALGQATQSGLTNLAGTGNLAMATGYKG